MQPAVGVHDPAVHRVGHAVDRVADVLARGDLENKELQSSTLPVSLLSSPSNHHANSQGRWQRGR